MVQNEGNAFKETYHCTDMCAIVWPLIIKLQSFVIDTKGNYNDIDPHGMAQYFTFKLQKLDS